MRPILILLLSALAFGITLQNATSPNKPNTPLTKPTDVEPAKQVPPITSPPRSEPRAELNGEQRVKEINDTLLVFFTGILAVVSYLQYRTLREHEKWMRQNVEVAKASADAAKKSADTSELALRIAERADVLLESCGVTGSLLSGSDWRIVVRFKNVGRTRATHVKISLGVILEGLPEEPAQVLPQITMGGGETQQVATERFSDFFDAKTASLVLTTHAIPLRFEARVTYKDVFAESHESRYTGTYDWETRSFHVDSQDSD
jgi:hypothetical protein